MSELPPGDSPALRAAVINIGCRLNQSEGDSLRHFLVRQGYRLAAGRGPASAGQLNLCIVNTCCVTQAAERSSMNRIHQIARLKPKPRLVVTGCLADRDRARVQAIPEVDEVWSSGDKERAVSGLTVLPDRDRAFVKVQDGCPNHCSFCVVRGLRGPPCSKPPEAVGREVAELAGQGFAEIVLVGLNLGRYGADRGSSLPELLDAIGQMPLRLMLRLSSIEPETMTGELLARIGAMSVMRRLQSHPPAESAAGKAAPYLCPHFHIPLQSGDDRLLRAMNRCYTAEQYRGRVGGILELRPDANIGTDVIVGFPGEDDSSFRATRRLLEELPLGYLHIFSYSPRPGTPAAELCTTIPGDVKRQWVAELRALGIRKAEAYRARFLGQVRPGVVITGNSGRSLVLTDNYIRVYLTGAAEVGPRALTAVRITRADSIATEGVVDTRILTG